MTDEPALIAPIDLLDVRQVDAALDWIGVHAAVQRDLFGEGVSAWTLEEVRGLQRSPSGRRGTLLPTVASVRTGNSDSDAHMLAVNRRLGHAVDGWTRERQQRVAQP